MIHTEEWRLQAACRGSDTELWFPVSAEPTDAQLAPALAFCHRCPVRRECGLARRRTDCGIWGGRFWPPTWERHKNRPPREGASRIFPGTPDGVLVERARRGLPVRAAAAERRQIVAHLSDVPELRLSRAFDVTAKTIYNDRLLIARSAAEAAPAALVDALFPNKPGPKPRARAGGAA